MTDAPLPLVAFLGDPAVRQAALARLDAAMPTGPAPSLSQRAADADDASAWEQRLGLPRWLALVVDTLPTMLGSDPRGRHAAATLLGAVAPGDNVTPTGSRILVHWLADPVDGALRHASDPALASLLEEAAALQRRCVADRPPAAGDWKSLRTRVGAAATGTIGTDPHAIPAVHDLVARCAEAACWDPARSRSTVVDTLYAWLQLQRAMDEIASGWGPQRDEQVKSHLDALNNAAIAQGAQPGTVDVFKLLEQSHPEEAAELRAHIARGRTDSAARLQQAIRLVADLLAPAA